MRESALWDEEFDVVVAGGGGAGLIAAVEAADRDARVLLVEKQLRLGGATGMAIGSITAAGTAWQRAAGIEDSVEAHYRDVCAMIAATRRADFNLELTRLMVEEAPGALARLAELGVRFSGPHPEPPHTAYRMHNAVPDSGAYVETLSRAARDRGVAIRTATALRELRRDEDGGVTGVLVAGRVGQASRRVRARKGVVLAAGDFSANDALARAHGRPPRVSSIPPMRPYATGDGLLAAVAVGAAAVGLAYGGFPTFRTVQAPFCAPERSLFVAGAVLVNRQGRRFANELAQPVFATSEQPGKVAWIVFDARLAGGIATAADDTPPARDGWYKRDRLFLSTFPAAAYAYLEDYRRNTRYFFEADSVTSLAQQIGVPAAALTETLDELNDVAAGRRPDVFGREPAGPGVSTPPLYAIGPVQPVLIFSAGGLSVDAVMRVLDTRGRPIPGLYAAGANAEAGVFLGGHGHHLAWVFGTGRIAGRNAAGV